MRHRLFGEWLSSIVALSSHDISEILAEQEVNPRPFGEIALAWGLCRPQDVWCAWWNQLASQTRSIDLARIGVDSQAVGLLPHHLARQFCAIPLRAVGRQIVVAVAATGLDTARMSLPALMAGELTFVSAPVDQIHQFIHAHYPSNHSDAASN